MEKRTIKKDLFCLPWTQTILGTHYEGRVNFMALDWLTRVNYQPPMLGICVNKVHASNAAIRDTGEFSVNGTEKIRDVANLNNISLAPEFYVFN